MYRVVNEVQIEMNNSAPYQVVDTDEVTRRFQQTFLWAAAELKEDLEALQNATFFTLSDLAVLDEQINAIDATARREASALERLVKRIESKSEDRWSLLAWWAHSANALELHNEDSHLLNAIRDNCENARQAVTTSSKAVGQMLSEMEYLSSLPTTRLPYRSWSVT